MVIFTVIAVVIAVALAYATIEGLDGWAQAVVLGVIVLTVIGAMIAVSPNRKA